MDAPVTKLNQPSEKVLILSYFFPPCNKVGGRRWAKFGKYLKELGYEVYVVCVNVPFKGVCPWEKDIKSYEENIRRLPYKETRPFYQLNKAPASLAGKLHYRLSFYKFKFMALKNSGDRQDISRGYKASLIKNAERIIQNEQIKNVIVTGGPFHWCYDALELKKKFSGLNFIVDLRDFWSGGDSYQKLNGHNKLIETNKEKECVYHADMILTPADRIAEHLKITYSRFKNKIHVLPHAYDEHEIVRAVKQPLNHERTITFAYGGILYGNMEAAILKLIELLKRLMQEGYKVQLDFYTFDTAYYDVFVKSQLTDVVNYHAPILPEELFKILSGKDYILQLRAGEALEQHFKSTKFYELIALGRPILYFGPGGDVVDFICRNKLGFNGNMDINELARSVMENKKNPIIPENFDVSQFGFKNITRQLMTYLK